MIVAAALLLLAPSLIDWTDYRSTFAGRLTAVTGRPVSIDGAVDFVILPRPAFNANAVRVAGDIAGDFISVERMSARLAFLPLLRGDFEFRELVLRRLDGRMTRGEDGKIDFINLDTPSPAASSAAGSEFPQSALMDMHVERLLIEDGALTFQDLGHRTTSTARGIDLAVVVRPQVVTIAGDITLGAVPVTLEAAVGRGSGTKAISATLNLLEADALTKFSGTFTPQADTWELRGDFNVTSGSTSTLLAALGVTDAATPVPGALQRPFSLSAKIRGSADAMAADPLSLDFGGTPATGSVVWRAGMPPELDVKLETGAVDVEAWRLAAMAPASFPSMGFVSPARAQAASASPDHAAFAPLDDLSVNFDLRMPVLTYRGQILRGGVVTAALAAGELTITEASVELPGGTRARAFGVGRFGAEAAFEGALEMQTGNLRGTLSWLALDPGADKPLPGRLSNASFRAAVQGTPSQLTLSDVTATIDTSALTGRMSWQRGARPLWGVDLTVNALNIDVYRPLFEKAKSAAAPPAGAASAPAGPSTYGVTPAFTALEGLAAFDADVHLQIDALTLGGIANGKAGIDFALRDSTLNVRSASFENVGGATAWFSGTVGGFGVTPRFDGFQFDLSADDLARVSRAFGFEIPEPLLKLKPVSLTGILKGTLAQAEVAATFKAAGLTVQADGQALNIEQQPHLAMNVAASQSSYAALMKAAELPWPIAMADPGAVKFNARVTHDASNTKIESLALHIGDNALTGELNIARTGAVPEITGTLSDVALAMDRLWPKAPPSLALTPVVAPRPAAKTAAKPPVPPWSEDSFDWSALKGWRGNIQISGTSFSLRGLQAQQFQTRLIVGDGVGEITEWSGRVFGAPGQVYLRAAAEPVPLVQGEIAFIGGDLGAVAAAVNGGAPILKSQGKADFAGSFRAQGANPAAMAASLSGSGSVKVSATEAGTGVISGLLGAVVAATQVEGGAQRSGTVTLETRFSAADGRIKIEDATVASKSYGGAFTGFIDLARWLVDLSGRLRLEAGGQSARPAAVPITVKGALDLPNIMILPSKP